MAQPWPRRGSGGQRPRHSRAGSASGPRGSPSMSSRLSGWPASWLRATRCWRHWRPSQRIRSTAKASSTSWASTTPVQGDWASTSALSQRQGRGLDWSSWRWRAAMPPLGSTNTSSQQAASSGQPRARAWASCRANSPSPGPVSTRARGLGVAQPAAGRLAARSRSSPCSNASSASHSASWGASRAAKSEPRDGEVTKSPRRPIRNRPLP